MSEANQPPQTQPEGFEWERERTAVDRRKSPRARISRFFRSIWVWAVIIGIIVVALYDPTAMRVLTQVLSLVFFIAAFAAIFIGQFALLFWFLSRSRMYTIMPGAEGVSFEDYRGQPEVLEQAKQVVVLLRGVKAFEEAGGEPLNGLLFEGPPGTGKTWLAQAISTEANVPFFYIDSSSLQAMFIGVGAFKVIRMYAKARKFARLYGASVIFLDEIDSIGSRSGVSSVGGDDGGGGGGGFFQGGGNMGILSTMLIEMSGFSLEHGWKARLRTWWHKRILKHKPPKPQRRVLTIGATNRIQALDPALLRPGRFDKKIRIDAPDMEGRRDIFDYYLSKMAHNDSMDSVVLASETPSYTPADIKYVLNETLRYALFEGRVYMTYRDFQRAQPEHEMGLRSPIKHMSAEGRERIAYREAGLATAVRIFLPHYRIARATIIRQGILLGHVRYFPAREAYEGLAIKDELLNVLRVAAARRASEIEFCGAKNQTLGYGRDYARVRQILQNMAAAGMLGPLGGSLMVQLSIMGRSVDYPQNMSEAMEKAYQDALQATRKALRERKDVVEAFKNLLLEREELLADDVQQFFDQHDLPTPEVTLIRDGQEYSLIEKVIPDSEVAAD
jgi:cell division protease FtsH